MVVVGGSQVPAGRRYSPKSEDVGLLGERKLVLLGVGRQLLDELGRQVTEPAVGDPQFVFPAAVKRKNSVDKKSG